MLSSIKRWGLLFIVILVVLASISWLVAIRADQVERYQNVQTNSAGRLPPSPSSVSYMIPNAPESTAEKVTRKLYESKKLRVRFTYPEINFGLPVHVKEVGNKIFVYVGDQPYDEGQWLEVFTKEPNFSLAQAVNTQFLSSHADKSCKVMPSEEEKHLKNPTHYESVFVFADKDEPTDCPYGFWGGANYFLMDKRFLDRFLYVNIGQYAICGSNEDCQPWQYSIEFIK